MDFQITTTIISIIISLVATIIAVIEFRKKSVSYLKLSRERERTIQGKWNAEFVQHELNKNLEIIAKGIVNIEVQRKRVIGEISYNVISGNKKIENQVFKIKGGFVRNQFLELNYETNDKQRIQFGKIFLRLHSNGVIMEGKLIGYGYSTEKIVSGNVTWKKM